MTSSESLSRNIKLFALALIPLLFISLVALTAADNTARAEIAINADRPLHDISRHDLYLEDQATFTSQHVALHVEPGDSLGPLLQEHGIEPVDAYNITKVFSDVFDPRLLRVGQTFNIFVDNQGVEHLTFKPSVERTIYLSRTKDGSYKSRDITAELKTEIVRVSSQIENSLYLDANRFGAPDKVIQQFANIYEYSVDFQRDIRAGDAFEMVFEVARDNRGNIVKAGDLLFTSFSPRGRTLEYYLYTDSNGDENFYDESGKTAKRKLRATPVNGARLSSRFGKRRHPILGYRKMHAGVDFAAPTGTPIMAAGNGVLEFVGRNGGYGKYIRIRHTDGYKTAYAHMSRYARGMRKGVRVTQDQIIGYVGTTGRSTGPHLHYEVHHNGKKINPSRLSQLSGKPIKASEMPAFQTRRAEIEALRQSVPTLQRTPPASELEAALID